MLIFTLPFKALSYNAYYRSSRNGAQTKTAAALEYDEDLDHGLHVFKDKLIDFAREYDPLKKVIQMDYTFYNPNYFIKDGSRMNKTSGDVDNRVKVLQDAIFRVMGLDDYVIKFGNTSEVPSDVHATGVSLWMRDHPNFISAYDLIKPVKPTEFHLFPMP